MRSLDEKYLKNLTFTAEQLSILRTIGEYQGKQGLYFKQSPEILKGLQQVAIIESSESLLGFIVIFQILEGNGKQQIMKSRKSIQTAKSE